MRWSRLRKALAGLALAGLMALAFGCDRGAPTGPALDLSIARDAYSGGYFLEAETAYERYLQADPEGKNRLEAWTRLVEIALGVKGDPDKAVSLLEAATLEFNARPEQNWPLLFKLGEVYEQLGQRKKAVDTWGRCADLALGDEKKSVQAHLRMAIANRALGKSDLSLDLLTQAAAQARDPELKSRCLYELAQTYGLKYNWVKTRALVEEILGMDKAPEEVRTMSRFLLVDAFEAEGNLQKAREVLLSLKDSYPNPEVIQARLGNIGKKDEGPAVAKVQAADMLPAEVDDAEANKKGRRRSSVR